MYSCSGQLSRSFNLFLGKLFLSSCKGWDSKFGTTNRQLFFYQKASVRKDKITRFQQLIETSLFCDFLVRHSSTPIW
ncbi:hypothetical protein DPMN_125171 [Dreissena polymorpha]|uniref:Uncharacterized protein n=1 Tax=Dreissena polymorpha TaxID=45954 RepID=A0A9D4JWV0_DREPO|nr:hypothetical protein DPMN_125171 [Dreissena polymorpha]